MKQLIESGAARIGAVIQDICANVDFEVVSLPGGSLIAILLAFYMVTIRPLRGTATQNRASGATATRRCASPRLPAAFSSLLAGSRVLLQRAVAAG